MVYRETPKPARAPIEDRLNAGNLAHQQLYQAFSSSDGDGPSRA
jgi:hypothetical protein